LVGVFALSRWIPGQTGGVIYPTTCHHRGLCLKTQISSVYSIMAQVAVSIRQALTQALPVYDYFGKNHTPPEPGSFTGLTLPPSFGILRNQADRRVHRGQQYLATLPPKWAAAQQRLNQPGLTPAQIAEIQETVDSARIFANNQEFIPGREANINHHNEADIVRTASLYLLHPVGQALWSDQTSIEHSNQG
jgi:hypothetical protein